MHDHISEIEDDPEIILKSLHTHDLPVQSFLHLDYDVVGNGGHSCCGIGIAYDEVVSNR